MILELLIIFIGFVISLVTLFTKELESNEKVKKRLAGLYIIVCAVSVVILILKSNDDKKSSLILYRELGNINSSVKFQSDTVQLILMETINLNHSLDSLNKITKNIIEQREKSQKIYQEQNKILDRSNELSQKRIYGERPEVVVVASEINFKSIDSSNSEILIKFINLGKRTASEFSNRVILTIKNNDGNYYGLIEIPKQLSKNGSFINADSHIEKVIKLKLGFEQIKSLCSGGTLIIYYNYYDEILNNYKQKEARFDFTNDWSVKNVLSNEDDLREKGLDEYLDKNIKYNNN